MLNFTIKINFSEKWKRCNQIKNVHIGENGQGSFVLKHNNTKIENLYSICIDYLGIIL